MKRAYIDIPEGQIHCRTEGNDEPLLLLHQMTLSSDEYSEVIPILAKRYWAIAMDTMGYGNSDLPPYEYTVEDHALSIIHFLDALEIKKANIVGHHSGASLAVETAAVYPARVDKLVISGCPYLEQEARKARQSDPRFKPVEIKEDGSRILRYWEDRKARYSAYTPPIMWQRMAANYLKAGLGIRAEDAHRAVFSYDIEPRLSLIESPTLLMVGTKDVFYSRLEATRKLIPRCRTKIIEDMDAFPAWEKPVEFA